jgi:hypothetical protein
MESKNNSLKNSLVEKTKKVGDLLSEKTLQTLWDDLVKKMNEAAEKGIPYIQYKITTPPFTVNDQSIKDDHIYKKLAQKLNAESLKHEILWKHECGYNEDCGSGCFVDKIQISWM